MKVLLFASIADIKKTREICKHLDAEETVSVEKVMEELGLLDLVKDCIFTVNLEQVDINYLLMDEDELAVIPPVSGG